MRYKLSGWTIGGRGLLLAGFVIAGPAAPQGNHDTHRGLAGCNSYNRGGHRACSLLAIPDHMQEMGQKRLEERAARRQRMLDRHMPPARETGNLEQTLRAQIEAAGGAAGLEAFVLPDSADLARIPQDPKNPLTPEKVALGQLLYHETAIALNPLVPSDAGTYSCASCHQADAGFGAGLVQGIGEGGSGFGENGGSRVLNPEIAPEAVDVQPISTPDALNLAWQDVMLHNGAFGATGPNAGTEYA